MFSSELKLSGLAVAEISDDGDTDRNEAPVNGTTASERDMDIVEPEKVPERPRACSSRGGAGRIRLKEEP
jgi:hypothetical protein